MSVQYGTHVRTILLIHSRWGGPNAWGRWNYLGWRETLLTLWSIPITRLGALPLGDR